MYPKLKGLMAEQNITQEEMADKIGISRATMSDKMNGKYEFKMSEIKKIMEFFNKSFEEIFFTK